MRDSLRAAVLPAFALAALLSAACARADDECSVEPREALALAEAPDGPLFLDVRSEREYRSGRVPGAVNVPHDEIEARIGELEADRERGAVVYCERGPRARKAIRALVAAGFRRVCHLEGDMSIWRRLGLPVER